MILQTITRNQMCYETNDWYCGSSDVLVHAHFEWKNEAIDQQRRIDMMEYLKAFNYHDKRAVSAIFNLSDQVFMEQEATA